MEFFHDESYQDEKERRIGAMMLYQLIEKLPESSKAAVMHDMPIHRSFGIGRGALKRTPTSFCKQAKNRRDAQNALLAYLPGADV